MNLLGSISIAVNLEKAHSNMRICHIFTLGLLALAAVSRDSALQAGPVGNSYTVEGVNVPNDIPQTSITFDGVAELVGGPSPNGLLVNESDTAFAGIPGGIATNKGPITQFEDSGALLEWTFNSADGGPYNNLPGAWSLLLDNLDFGTPQVIQKAYTGFTYFIGPAGPIVISPILIGAFDLQAGPHPTNPAITQVIYLEEDTDTVFSNGIISIGVNDDGTLNANTVALLAGVSPLSGFGLGALFVGVPEPSTWLLASLGLVALVPAIRRRRR